MKAPITGQMPLQDLVETLACIFSYAPTNSSSATTSTTQPAAPAHPAQEEAADKAAAPAFLYTAGGYSHELVAVGRRREGERGFRWIARFPPSASRSCGSSSNTVPTPTTFALSNSSSSLTKCDPREGEKRVLGQRCVRE